MAYDQIMYDQINPGEKMAEERRPDDRLRDHLSKEVEQAQLAVDHHREMLRQQEAIVAGAKAGLEAMEAHRQEKTAPRDPDDY